MADSSGLNSITKAEHIGPTATGDNVEAKRVVPYSYDPISLQWNRSTAASALVQAPYDYVGFSNADGNGNYQTVVFKGGGSGGTTVATLAITYDANNLMTSITRT